jgi:soluble lytic murein transglycosylase-like protein
VRISPVESDEAFKRTAIYQRIVNHPNAKRFESLIVRYAKQQNVDVALVKAVVAVESAFEPEAVSGKGAVGLMQVIPETAQRYGVNDDKRRSVAQKLLDPAINLHVGTRYLRDLLALFGGNVALALAAYNAGEGVVLHYANQIPPFPETQEFVKLVQQFYAMYQPPPGRAATKPTRITIPSKGALPR